MNAFLSAIYGRMRVDNFIESGVSTVKKRIYLLFISLLACVSLGLTTTSFTSQPVQAASKKYAQAKLVLPKGYTRDSLYKAYQGKASKTFIKASIAGMKSNDFSKSNVSESKKDDTTLVNPTKLTAKQNKELADFTLRIINQARIQLGLPKWRYSKGTTKLAADIASEYSKHKKGIQNGNHYVSGIVRACKKNGLNLNNNYVEDMAGFASKSTALSMTTLKKDIYFGLKQMIFGYTGPSEKYVAKSNLYREWEHAGDLFNTQGSAHDGDFNYFGLSISLVDHVYSLHFISVPSFIVNSKTYNRKFKI